jgi:hypothetical protein
MGLTRYRLFAIVLILNVALDMFRGLSIYLSLQEQVGFTGWSSIFLYRRPFLAVALGAWVLLQIPKLWEKGYIRHPSVVLYSQFIVLRFLLGTIPLSVWWWWSSGNQTIVGDPVSPWAYVQWIPIFAAIVLAVIIYRAQRWLPPPQFQELMARPTPAATPNAEPADQILRWLVRYRWTRLGHYLLDGTLILLMIPSYGLLLGQDQFLVEVLLFTFLYYLISELIFRQTPGKAITKMVVVGYATPPKDYQIALRSFSRIIPFEPFSLLFSHRAWHDALSATTIAKLADCRLEEPSAPSSSWDTTEILDDFIPDESG